MYYFQAQEKTTRTITLSLVTGSVFLILSLFLLVFFFGEKGIWFSWVLAQAMALVVSFSMYRVSILKEEKE